MSLTVNSRNEALNAISIDSMSLHSGFPGATGANELTGSGYARKSCTFGAASGATRSLTTVINFDVGAGQVVRWAGLWSGLVFKGYSPNGGFPREFLVDTVTDTVSCPAHGYAANQTVTFYGGNVPGGLTEGTIYYAVSVTTDAFKVSATSGGSAIDLTSIPSTDCVVSRVVEESYTGTGTHTINSWSLGAVF